MSEYNGPEDLRGEDGEREHRKVFIRRRKGDNVVNSNGSWRGFDIIRDMVTYALIPLLYIGYSQINGEISKNADLLRQVQGNQIRVMSTVNTMQYDLQEHESRSSIEAVDRGRVHHTSQRSCIECKMGGRDTYPQKQTGKENPFSNK